VLDRKFNPETSNQVWESDTTFIRSKEGWLYLCAVIDLFPGRLQDGHWIEGITLAL